LSDGAIGIMAVYYHAVNLIFVPMKLIVAHFITKEQRNEQYCCQADGQAQQVDQSKNTLPKQVSESNLGVVVQHKTGERNDQIQFYAFW
jgi:hypothetical protein